MGADMNIYCASHRRYEFSPSVMGAGLEECCSVLCRLGLMISQQECEYFPRCDRICVKCVIQN